MEDHTEPPARIKLDLDEALLLSSPWRTLSRCSSGYWGGCRCRPTI
jgi:hypothetical protein